jgi:hypothetical protein
MIENRNQASVVGDSWDRVCHIECLHGFGQVPSIRFDNERRTLLSDGNIIGVPTHSTTIEFTAPEKIFPLRNPATGELTGATMTHGQFYAVMYSLATQAELDREAGMVGEVGP